MPGTISMREPGARASAVPSVNDTAMQPSSAPCRYRVGWGGGVPVAAWSSASAGSWGSAPNVAR